MNVNVTNTMHTLKRWFFGAALALAPVFAYAAEAIVVDIDARTHHQDNPVSIHLDAGTYVVTPIGTFDGGAFDSWKAWSSTTCSDPSGCQQTSPTTVTGWLSDYAVRSTSLVSVAVDGVSLVLNYVPPGVESFWSNIYWDGGYWVRKGFVYPDPLSSFNASLTSTFTVNTSGLVGFTTPDCSLCLGDNSGGMSLKITPYSVTVGIDIKPGSDPNSINLSSSGVIPVAILSTVDFDAPASINPDTISLAGAAVKMAGKSAKYLCSVEDANTDGLDDLVCKVETAQFQIEPGDAIAILEAQTYDSPPVHVRGEDTVRIVPD